MSTPCFVATFCRNGAGNIDEGRIGRGWELHEPMHNGYSVLRPIIYPLHIELPPFERASDDGPLDRRGAFVVDDPFRSEPNPPPSVPHDWGVCRHCRQIVLFAEHELDDLDHKLKADRGRSATPPPM